MQHDSHNLFQFKQMLKLAADQKTTCLSKNICKKFGINHVVVSKVAQNTSQNWLDLKSTFQKSNFCGNYSKILATTQTTASLKGQTNNSFFCNHFQINSYLLSSSCMFSAYKVFYTSYLNLVNDCRKIYLPTRLYKCFQKPNKSSLTKHSKQLC